MIAATMKVATQVIWSNCLAESRLLRRPMKVQAVRIVARNVIDQYNDHIGCGENIVASAAIAPYASSSRDGALLGKWSLFRVRRIKHAAGSTKNGRTARIRFCQSSRLLAGWIFQNPVFRLHQRHVHSISADAGAIQRREDRLEIERV